MCLISAFPKGTKKNTEEVYDWIRNGAQSNNQGSGYAFKYKDDIRIYLSKGFFDVEDMITDIKKAGLKESDELIVHHRIATSGTDVTRNTHPFVIDFEFENITMVEGWTDKPVMAHNGMFSQYGGIDNRYNDTAHWIHLYMSNPHILNKLKSDPQGFYDDGYANITELRGNKLVFLFPDQDMVMMGNFTKEGKYYHSTIAYKNTSHYDRGGISGNTKFLGEGTKSLIEARNFTNDTKIITLKPETLYTGEVLGYEERKITVADKPIIVIDIEDQFLKLNFTNLHLFFFKNPVTNDFYYTEQNLYNNKDLLIPLCKYGETKINCVISLNDLITYKRRTKGSYISLIRDIYELNKLFNNKPSKNRRKKIESALQQAKYKKRDNLVIKGTERLICQLAVEMYLDNAKESTKNLLLAL